MTQEQFILWLEGFLDGKELSVNPALVKIKEKFDSIKSFSTHPPYVDGKGHPNPYYFTTTTFGRNDVTTAETDSTPTSVKQLLTDNHD